MNYKERYKEWMDNSYFSEEIKAELKAIEMDEKEVEDRFYRDLEFGTAGLRGKLAAGTNRMNIHIIGRATQALAQYIKDQGQSYMDRGVAIAYDCRHFSEEFAKIAALVLAGNGIKAYLFESLRPTPELSFTVRKLKTAAGIVVTASHNPKEYNGYKVYWEDGAQILSEIADAITEKIGAMKSFEEIKTMEEEEAKEKGFLQILGKDIDEEYVEKVKSLSIRDEVDKDIRIVYTPLNGAGNVLVRRVLAERGFKNVTLVPEQEMPDPDFTTIAYPNPEDLRAFEYAEKLGEKIAAELLIATDPDCDRLAIMVRDKFGKYIPFNGNQTGAILIKYIVEGRKEKGTLPKNGVIVKSIVTGDLGKAIGSKYGVDTIEALTGFKNICGCVDEFEKTGQYEFVFGYEESIGYTTGNFVRDKDAVIASMLLCEAAAYYKTKGKNLVQVLYEVYEELGYYRENLISLVLEGIEGSQRIARMMEVYRKEYPLQVKAAKLIEYIDYREEKIYNLVDKTIGSSGIPVSNVLKFKLDDGSWYAVRPSGTEPKIKLYMYSKGKSLEEAEEKLKNMKEVILNKLESVK